MRRLFFIIMALASCLSVCAGGTEKSDGVKPRWMKTLPVPSNNTYRFVKTETDLANSLAEARVASMHELAKSVDRTAVVESSEEFAMDSEQDGRNGGIDSENYKDFYMLTIKVDGEKQKLTYQRVDEYWESKTIGGRTIFKLYTLYAVNKPNVVPIFDDVRTTRYYGARGTLMSIIPGAGQMYKGSMVKGSCILGGTVLCAGGIVLCDNQRASYEKKMREQPQFAKTYNTKADNWETARNVCIGAAAALYIYNLIDASVAPGARRVKIKKNNTSVRFAPVAWNDGVGATVVCTF